MTDVWVAGREVRIEHSSPPGPWSGHTESLTWTARLELEDSTFRIRYERDDSHRASNRGSSSIYTHEYAGDIVRGAGLLLRITRRIVESYHYSEPAEDMWTPGINQRSARPPQDLDELERFAFRATMSADQRELSLAIESIGATATTNLVGSESKFLVHVTGTPLHEWHPR